MSSRHSDHEICFASAAELRRMVLERRISWREVTQIILGRIARVDPAVHAYITVTPETALNGAGLADLAGSAGEPTGKLSGLLVSIKDLTPTAGIRTTYGVADHARTVPDADAPIVQRIRAAGGSILGKTSTPPYGWLGVTENDLVGKTNNPWNLCCTVGGSSGGAAAALAAGMGALATGSDGGGSIRVPASLCGVVGLKPSHGRIPRGTEGRPFETVDALGPMARTVDDVALLLSTMAGPVETEPFMLPESGIDYAADLRAATMRGRRIAYCPSLDRGPVDPEVALIVDAAARHFAGTLGANVDIVDVDIADPVDYFLSYYPPTLRSFIDEHPAFMSSLLQKYPGVVEVAESERGALAHDWWDRTQTAREKTFAAVAAVLSQFDFLLTPTTPVTAWPHEREMCPAQIAGKAVSHRQIEAFRFTEPFGHSGHPALSICCGFTASGLPVGLQIVGRQRDDRGVLAAGAAYEATTPWHARHPEELI